MLTMLFHMTHCDLPSRRCGAGRTSWPLVLSILCSAGLALVGRGAEITVQAPALLALPAERLLIEQTGELIQAGQIDEALRLLEKLVDEAENRLVVAGAPQRAASLTTQLYIPLGQWAARHTTRTLSNFPEAAAKVETRQREPAKLALAQLQQTKDIRSAQRAVRRFSTPALGTDFQLLLSDLYLERGWGLAASQAVEAASSETRFHAQPQSRAESRAEAGQTIDNDSLAASLVWQQLTTGRSADEQDQIWQDVFATRYLPGVASAADSLDAVSISQVVRRLATAAAMNPQTLDKPAVLGWAKRLAQHVGGSSGKNLAASLQQIELWPPLTPSVTTVDSFHRPLLYPDAEAAAPKPSLAVDNSTENIPAPAPVSPQALPSPRPLSAATWPKWSHPLDRFSATNDLTSTHGAPVAESSRVTLPYYPAVHDGVVFVNELTRIVAYDVETGAPWPPGSGEAPLFEGELSAASYLPLGYPMVGSPRGTLSIYNGCLYARMGSPVTGRLHTRGANAGRSDTSLSYLVGLDISKQGSMLPGFPLYLRNSDFPEAEFSATEFDGPPLAWGDLLIVAIAQRDHVGLRRSLAAFDRITGELRWQSGVLASGNIADAQHANLIAHQQLTLVGGRLYYNTHLGSIVCLDPLNGQTQWLAQYSTPPENPAFPKPKRYRYRDLTPCLLSAGLVFCAPQDAPEIFALDAITGELVWSTDQSSVADAVQLLGAEGDSLIVSGDRLVWLDKRSGRVTTSFPGSTTPIVGGALPSPRGLGRGFISGQYVYWPTAAEIFVFTTLLPRDDSSAQQSTPAIVGRIPIRPSGAEGVNVLVVDRRLLVASPSRLMAFESLGHSAPPF